MDDAIERDPRLNAPPRVSDLRGDELRQVLLARDHKARVDYMAHYRAPPKPGLVERFLSAVLG